MDSTNLRFLCVRFCVESGGIVEFMGWILRNSSFGKLKFKERGDSTFDKSKTKPKVAKTFTHLVRDSTIRRI